MTNNRFVMIIDYINDHLNAYSGNIFKIIDSLGNQIDDNEYDEMIEWAEEESKYSDGKVNP